MKSEKELDALYAANTSPGWLCRHLLTKEEENYLIWRDDNDYCTYARLKSWMDQIERDGGIEVVNADTTQQRLNAICNAINRVDLKCANLNQELAEATRSLLGYRNLMNMRVILKLDLDAPDMLPEATIQKARDYRLDSLLHDKLKRKFMKCPVHTEKHGSFFVTSYGYCFGCGRSWDSIGWLQEFENMSFKEAVKYLSNL